jgi:hypothetical protein
VKRIADDEESELSRVTEINTMLSSSLCSLGFAYGIIVSARRDIYIYSFWCQSPRDSLLVSLGIVYRKAGLLCGFEQRSGIKLESESPLFNVQTTSYCLSNVQAIL